MTFKIEFDCDNAAFEQDPHGEISRILKDVARKISNGQTEGAIMDANGNRVGEFDCQC